MPGPRLQAALNAARKYWLHTAAAALIFCWYAEGVRRQYQVVAGILAAGGQVTYDLYGAQEASTWRKPVVVRTGDAHLWCDLYRTPTDVLASNCREADALCGYLAQLPELRFLKLESSELTDAGIAKLANLEHLEALNCNDTKLTDVGLISLGRLSNVWQLMLSNTQITDQGLVHLTSLSHLRWLAIERTGVSESAVERLQRDVPTCGAVVLTPAASTQPASSMEWLAAGDDSLPSLAPAGLSVAEQDGETISDRPTFE